MATIRRIGSAAATKDLGFRIVRSALIALAVASGPAKAQTSDSQEEIVVTGTRDVDDQVQDFVGALARMPAGERAARFEQDFCPAIVGATEAGAQLIAARLRVVARAVGMGLGKPDCVANALVILTDDKRQFIEMLAKKRPEFLGDLTPQEVRRLVRSPGPAAAWQLVGKVNSRGVPIVADSGGVAVNRTVDSPSRITTSARPVFEAAALVVERSSVQGLDATQVADYAAMRLLARTEPSRVAGSGVPTILAVLEAPMGTEVPLGLTEWDLGYLKGLYSSSGVLQGGAQRAAIAKEVAREVAGAD